MRRAEVSLFPRAGPRKRTFFEEARGNSSQSRQSFIYLSDLAGRRPGRPQDAIRATVGDRRPPGRIVGTPWVPRRHIGRF